MGFFSGITKAFSAPFKAVGNILGGGGGGESNNSTTTSTSVNPVTNVTNKIDLEPVAEILAKSNAQSAKAQKEAQQIALINAERERQLEVAKLNKLDTYMEHAKNGLILSAIAASFIYVSKKQKRR